MASTEVEEIINKFNSFTQKPVKFLTVQEDVKEDIKNFVKTLYDFTKAQERKEKKGALPELIISDFDEEQIWQELELQNTECYDDLVWDVANCISGKSTLKFPVKVSTENSESDTERPQSDNEKSPSETEDEPQKKTKKIKKSKAKRKGKPSVVDDKFFKLNEMEQFLLKEEKQGDRKPESGSEDDEAIDMFDDIDDEESDDETGENKDMMYNDFFENEENEQDDHDVDSDPEASGDDIDMDENEEDVTETKKKGQKKVQFAGLMSDDESDAEDGDDNEEESANKLSNDKKTNEKKSDFEYRQERLQQTITRLEEKNLKEASWQLKGEVDAAKRPQNSLLQEVVDFDLTSRPPPVITEETTLTLEEIIKQRVKDRAWDDVTKKEKPVDDQLAFRKQEVLDHSKSKLSLAQVYEAEYLKQKQAKSGDVEEEKEPEEHTQVRDAMSKLFAKLDALCHYHYTPKAPQAEVKIVSNTPAISMEEVAPVATSEAALLAPEEVKRKRKGDLMSKEERTKSDQNRERRKKKKLQRKKGQVTKVTEQRNTKQGVEVADKSLKTSKAFFQQLNDDSTSLIKKNKSSGKKRQ